LVNLSEERTYLKTLMALDELNIFFILCALLFNLYKW